MRQGYSSENSGSASRNWAKNTGNSKYKDSNSDGQYRPPQLSVAKDLTGADELQKFLIPYTILLIFWWMSYSAFNSYVQALLPEYQR